MTRAKAITPVWTGWRAVLGVVVLVVVMAVVPMLPDDALAALGEVVDEERKRRER